MRKWLSSIADQLQSIEVHSQEDNGKRMASALAIVVCLDELIPSIFKIESVEFRLMELLFVLLYPRPNCEKYICHDINFVLCLVPQDSRKKVHDALNSFCMELSHKKHLHCPYWLYALPLLHLLRDSRVRPFRKLQCGLKDIPWVDTNLGLGTVRSATVDKTFG